MEYQKNQKCTQCGTPDEFSDETLCHTCIESWRATLELKAFIKGKEEGQMLGLKAGLEVAKDIAKREGFEFSFPDPETIKLEKDSP